MLTGTCSACINHIELCERASSCLQIMSVGEYLLDGTLGLEEDASAKQLGKDAAHRPDVDGVGIVPAPHQDLWRSVVLRHHLLGHVTRRIWLLHSCQAKVTNLNAKEKWHFSFCHYYMTEYI